MIKIKYSYTKNILKELNMMFYSGKSKNKKATIQ